MVLYFQAAVRQPIQSKLWPMFLAFGGSAMISVSSEKTFGQCVFLGNVLIPRNDCHLAIEIAGGTTVDLKYDSFEFSAWRCNLIDYGCRTHVGKEVIEECDTATNRHNCYGQQP